MDENKSQFSVMMTEQHRTWIRQMQRHWNLSRSAVVVRCVEIIMRNELPAYGAMPPPPPAPPIMLPTPVSTTLRAIADFYAAQGK